VRLKPFPRRNIEAVMDEVRQKVGGQVPGLEIELARLMEDLIGDLTAVPQPIEGADGAAAGKPAWGDARNTGAAPCGSSPRRRRSALAIGWLDARRIVWPRCERRNPTIPERGWDASLWLPRPIAAADSTCAAMTVG